MSLRSPYRADLDGLRAVAVVPVVLYHLGVPGFPGGFAGVDVFFVLSGFLITGLIAADLREGTFSLINFYDRRIRRIFPALAVVLAFCTFAALLVLFPTDLKQFGSSLTAASLAASNVIFARQSYFAPNAELSPLLHTWSLAVEEQFYLLFPVALWLIWRSSGKWLAAFIWSALAMSLALSIAGVWLKPTPTFYLLPTRAWELLVGSVLALGLVPRASAGWQREAGAAAGILLILAAIAFYTRDSNFPGLAALVPCLGAGLVIWSGVGWEGQTLMGRLLATGVPVFIGLISYSLYLWHWPLIVFAKRMTNGELTPVLQVALALAAVALAVLSWRYVEKPLRAGGWPWPTPSYRFAAASIGLLAFVLAGVGLRLAQGFPQRLPLDVREIADSVNDSSPIRSRCHAASESRTFASTCVLGAPVSPNVVVFADSHGAELSAALGEVAQGWNLSIRQITASGCPPAVGLVAKDGRACAKHVEEMLRALMQEPPSKIVLMAYYFRWMRSDSSGNFRDGFTQTVRSLRRAGHTVILVGAVPDHPAGIDVPIALARWVYYGGPRGDYRFDLDEHAAHASDTFLRSLADETGSIYVPLVPYFCPDERGCRAFKDGSVLYFDADHMSLSAARKVAVNVLSPVIWPEHLTNSLPPLGWDNANTKNPALGAPAPGRR